MLRKRRATGVGASAAAPGDTIATAGPANRVSTDAG
jgi:hypothetical protein